MSGGGEWTTALDQRWLSVVDPLSPSDIDDDDDDDDDNNFWAATPTTTALVAGLSCW